MPLVAVIGGIGSGKTAVTDYLASRGASVVDADEIARDVVSVGRPAWQALRDAFGDAILAADGSLDRSFVAEIVFHDAAALRRLNHITHGAIGVEMARQIAEHATSPLTVVAIPLFRPVHRELLQPDEVWCVYVDAEIAVQRLVSYRGFTEADARARLASQSTNTERFALSDRTFDNSGTLAQLHHEVNVALMDKGWLGV